MQKRLSNDMIILQGIKSEPYCYLWRNLELNDEKFYFEYSVINGLIGSKNQLLLPNYG